MIWPLAAKMNRAVDRVVAGHAEIDRLDDVDLARCRPATVDIVLRQHPERGPDALAGRQTDTCLDPAVAQCKTVARVDAC